MKKIAVLHFSPIEKYPPVTNLLDFLSGTGQDGWDIRVYSTALPNPGAAHFTPPADRIRITRIGSIPSGGGSFKRYWSYFRYYGLTFLKLLLWRPDLVLYYETLSAMPAILYKKTVGRGAAVFAHYHEYISPEEYRDGIPLNRIQHRMERKMYPVYKWISHTNADRMRLFLQDNKNIQAGQTFLLPNYPPRSWGERAQAERAGGPVRFVYVGALSMGNMYTAEFAEWVKAQEGKVSWDIFTSNNTSEAREFIEALGCEHVRFRGEVNYAGLPEMLKEFDVGVVLYKGTIPNYVYNVPNKLNEYFACGLDVWFPREMASCMAVVTEGSWPRITAMDFQRLDGIDLTAVTDRSGLLHRPSVYFYDTVLPLLLAKIEEAMRPGRSLNS